MFEDPLPCLMHVVQVRQPVPTDVCRISCTELGLEALDVFFYGIKFLPKVGDNIDDYWPGHPTVVFDILGESIRFSRMTEVMLSLQVCRKLIWYQIILEHPASGPPTGVVLKFDTSGGQFGRVPSFLVP